MRGWGGAADPGYRFAHPGYACLAALPSLRYLKAIISVRLSVEAPAFKGSFSAFELC